MGPLFGQQGSANVFCHVGGLDPKVSCKVLLTTIIDCQALSLPAYLFQAKHEPLVALLRKLVHYKALLVTCYGFFHLFNTFPVMTQPFDPLHHVGL